MRTARRCAQQLLLPAWAGICRGTRASEAARPDFHRPSGLRQPAAASGALARGDLGWPPTGPAADAETRVMGSPPEAGHPAAAFPAHSLSLPSAWPNDRPAATSV